VLGFEFLQWAIQYDQRTSATQMRKPRGELAEDLANCRVAVGSGSER
jgi:hypothetical protein